jgi:hypothetical protein
MELDGEGVAGEGAFDVEGAGLGVAAEGAANSFGVEAAGVDRPGFDGVAGVDAQGGRDRAGEVAVEDGGVEGARLRRGGSGDPAGFPGEDLVLGGLDGSGDGVALDSTLEGGFGLAAGGGSALEEAVAFERPGVLEVVEGAGDPAAVGLELEAGRGTLLAEADHHRQPLAGQVGGGGKDRQEQDEHRSEHAGLYVGAGNWFL